MSFISKDHFGMALKSIKKLLGQKADKSDIVQSDWSQNDETKPDYVRNRTHYESNEVLWQHTFTESEYRGNFGYNIQNVNFVFSIGDTYLVEVDGIEFECRAYEEFGSGMTILGANNGDIWFQIRSGYNAGVNKQCTLVVKASTPTVHKLDEKFIPDNYLRYQIVEEIPTEQEEGVLYIVQMA